MLVERQLHYKIQSQANALEAFHKKVKERLKISRRETTMGSTIIPAPNIVVERHKVHVNNHCFSSLITVTKTFLNVVHVHFVKWLQL